MNIQNHLPPQVSHKVSHFLLGEEGKVGSQSAFTAAAFIGATSLAGILLGAPAEAVTNCGPATCNDDSKWCCLCWAHGYCERIGQYNCKSDDMNLPGISCWKVVQ